MFLQGSCHSCCIITITLSASQSPSTLHQNKQCCCMLISCNIMNHPLNIDQVLLWRSKKRALTNQDEEHLWVAWSVWYWIGNWSFGSCGFSRVGIIWTRIAFINAIRSHQTSVWVIWRPKEHLRLFVVFFEYFIRNRRDGQCFLSGGGGGCWGIMLSCWECECSHYMSGSL